MKDVFGGDAETLEFVGRQVDAAAARILADVANDVGELEGEAEIVGVLQGAPVFVAEDLGGEQADHAGHPVAVEVQRLEVGIAGLRQVHFHAVDDLGEQLLRQVEGVRGFGEGLRDGVAGFALVGASQFGAPPGEPDARQLRVGAFVDDVIHLPAEGVERGDGAAARWRQEEEAVIEAGPALRRLLLAVFVRCHLTTFPPPPSRGRG